MERTRVWIAAMIYPIANAVLFGAGAALVLTVPYLRANSDWALPGMIVAALVLAMPISYMLAPRLRQRYWREREDTKADGFDAVLDEMAK